MKFLARRSLHAFLLLNAIAIISFVFLQSAPGNYFDVMRLNPRISAETVSAMEREYDPHKSLAARYESWMISLAKGDMGYSLSYREPVAPILWSRARNTLLLTGSATLLAWLIGVPLGVWSGVRKNRWPDRVCGAATSTLLTIPDLLLFLMLLLLAVRSGWFPTGGMISPDFGTFGFLSKMKDAVWHFALPTLGLALVMVPVILRHVRSAMLDALDAPFLRAARGHGIRQTRLLFRYALRAAANPLISLLGFSIATMLSASVIAEVILSWPGLGPLMVQAILARDVYVVAGVVMLASLFLIGGNLLADVLLYAADPRIRTEGRP